MCQFEASRTEGLSLIRSLSMTEKAWLFYLRLFDKINSGSPWFLALSFFDTFWPFHCIDLLKSIFPYISLLANTSHMTLFWLCPIIAPGVQVIFQSFAIVEALRHARVEFLLLFANLFKAFCDRNAFWFLEGAFFDISFIANAVGASFLLTGIIFRPRIQFFTWLETSRGFPVPFWVCWAFWFFLITG